MKKLAAIISLLSAAALPVCAQTHDHAQVYAKSAKYPPMRASEKPKYNEWGDNPKIHPLDPQYDAQPAIYLKNEVSVDYRYEGKGVSAYQTIHYLVKVIDERGIEAFNKVRIPVSPGTRVPLIRARTITQSGKVYEIAKDMIKVATDEHGGNSIVIVLEGVEKNAEIEILAKTTKTSSYYGHYTFQAGIPVLSARFELSYPKDMIFEMRSHNGFPQLTDSIERSRKHFVVELNDIPALEAEQHSFPSLRLMGIEYRLKNWTGNTERVRLNTWDDYGRRLWDNNYKLTENEKRAVNMYLSELGVRANGNEVDNIRKIEKGIKTGIALYEVVDYDLRKQVLATRNFRSISLYATDYDETKDVLDSIILKKAATATGYVKLFAACLAQAGVKHQLGTTGERGEYTFDKNFENFEDMDQVLFYFPNQKKYLSPTSIYYRYPMIPYELLNSKGVFCNIPPNGVPIGTLFEFRTISSMKMNESQSNITAAVSFTKDMDALMDVSYSYSGYLSTQLRSKLAFTRPDRVKEVVQKMLPFLDRPENLTKYTISNEGFNNYYSNKPLEVYASLTTSSLVEKAGANYLIKVGDIIGEQDELYSEKERKMPVDLTFPHSENRTITIMIPKGYKVLNPEVLQTGNDYLNSDMDGAIGFKSDYTIVKDKVNGDKLTITINEYYSQTHFNKSEYERYRKVVNTAADFNKVALLIGKKPV